jgi:hypothetical protein
MDSEEYTKLQKLYGQLGQILDGVWFTCVEKAVGFEKAYEIDDEVWKIYSRKEAKRLRSFFGFTTPNVSNIENVIRYSLFAQSLEFDLIVKQKSPLILHMLVKTCKTIVGMEKMGRSADQIDHICRGIGLTYFGALLDEISSGVIIRCQFTPITKSEQEKFVCVWEFEFPNLSIN